MCLLWSGHVIRLPYDRQLQGRRGSTDNGWDMGALGGITAPKNCQPLSSAPSSPCSCH